MKAQSQNLFSDGKLKDELEYQKVQLLKEINSLEANYLLNVNIPDLSEHLIEKYTINVPIFEKDKIEIVDHGEHENEVESHGRNIKIKENYYIFSIPYSGNGRYFRYQPSVHNYNPPTAIVCSDEIKLFYSGTDINADIIRTEINKVVSDIEKWLAFVRCDTKKWNENIITLIPAELEKRKSKLIHDQGIIEALGFPLRKRTGMPNTYTVPIERKKIKYEKPKVTKKIYKPEPSLDLLEYVNILNILSNMVLVMEKSPNAFKNMDEETLRTHFLVQLNGQYEGQATGETFNYEGKTDILINVKGKNIFIAECKFWNGPKSVSDTIDQLIKYLSWRDTKTAILIFNRNQNLTKVLDQIPDIIKDHSSFKRYEECENETRFRFILKNKSDVNKEIIVTLMVFDIPK